MPADESFLPLVEYAAGDAASRASLTQDQHGAVVAAARLGFETIVRQAMAESREPIRFVATCTPARLVYSFFERGLPLDDAMARRDPRWIELSDAVDEAHWHSHGSAGSELRLVVNRPHGGAAMHEHPSPIADDDVPLAPEQTYAIRRFEPRDAAGVARAFYYTYGYHYDLPAVYVPDRLVELNRLNLYTSIVAADENGEIAGHYALAREGDEPIADGCGAVVLPAHRGRNLLNLMRAEAEREAVRIGLAAYYSEPVTDHGRTQKASETFGAKACGITLGEAPRSFVAKHMELSTTVQRQSCMLYVKPLGPRERRTVYIPPHHRAIVTKIYGQLGLAIDESHEHALHERRGAFRTSVIKADQIANVVVETAGTQTAQLLRQAIDDLRAMHHLGAIYASLSLEDPGTPAICEKLENAGFYFAGVGPWMHDGRDALRLQMTLTPIDLDGLTIVSDFGKELLQYIARERERCTAAT